MVVIATIASTTKGKENSQMSMKIVQNFKKR